MRFGTFRDALPSHPSRPAGPDDFARTPVTQARANRPPLGMLGAMALILGVEWFIASHKLDVMDMHLKSVDHIREVAASGAKDCDLLAFGDSMVKTGVSPKVIRRRSGLKGYNFAIAGTQAPAAYFLLRDALASGARPKVVLVDFFPELLTTDPWVNIVHWPVLASFRDSLDLAWYAGDPKFLAALMAGKALPSVCCRGSIRAAILEALRGQGGATRNNLQIGERFWDVNRGFEGSKPLPDSNHPVEFWIGQYFRSIDCTAANRHFVDRFMELAAEHGVKVCLLLPPYVPHLQAKVEEVGFHAKHDAWVRSLLDRHPGLDVLDARRSGYDRSAFRDVNHLVLEGASVLSDDVGELLRRKLADPGSVPRWAAMPAFRPRPVAAPYEDIGTSASLVLEQIRVDQTRRR